MVPTPRASKLFWSGSGRGIISLRVSKSEGNISLRASACSGTHDAAAPHPAGAAVPTTRCLGGRAAHRAVAEQQCRVVLPDFAGKSRTACRRRRWRARALPRCQPSPRPTTRRRPHTLSTGATWLRIGGDVEVEAVTPRRTRVRQDARQGRARVAKVNDDRSEDGPMCEGQAADKAADRVWPTAGRRFARDGGEAARCESTAAAAKRRVPGERPPQFGSSARQHLLGRARAARIPALAPRPRPPSPAWPPRGVASGAGVVLALVTAAQCRAEGREREHARAARASSPPAQGRVAASAASTASGGSPLRARTAAARLGARGAELAEAKLHARFPRACAPSPPPPRARVRSTTSKSAAAAPCRSRRAAHCPRHDCVAPARPADRPPPRRARPSACSGWPSIGVVI